jgi:hypothetical protein
MKIVKILLINFIVLAFTFSFAGAKDVNPNGFPSGPHYNLNIIGKKAEFICPELEYDEYGNIIYGNVVFVNENGEDIKIYMQSGKGKKAAAITELRAIDPCSGFDGDAAVIQLPKNEAGYSVYARALAKPTYNPEMSISPELVAVEDENGNDLMYLGLVTNNGFETPYVSFTRKKGKSRALDITGLFLWSGTVCYLSEPEIDYQYTGEVCCIDFDLDGIVDECVEPVLDINTGLTTCPEGYASTTIYCSEYQDEWVFNIGDFVTYLWNIENNGLKLLQVRFYPN